MDEEARGEHCTSKHGQPNARHKRKPRQNGREALPLEDKVFNSLREKLDDVYAVEAELIMAGHSRTTATLQAHSDNMFQGASEAGYRAKLGHWLMYLKTVYPERTDIVAIGDVSMPPSLNCRKQFLWKARPQFSSYGSFKNVIVNVCWLASRYFPAFRLIRLTPGGCTCKSTLGPCAR